MKWGAEFLFRLEHPNAVAIYDTGIVGDLAYIEMEYIEGQTLRRRLKPGEPLPPRKVERLLRELCEVLDQAHKIGIVHRDIKPENIMIFTDPASGLEQTKVLDFGILKILADGPGTIAGTPAYMAPEQIRGDFSVRRRFRIDRLSDIYSVGVMFYEVLTGARPFAGANVIEILSAHIQTPPPPFSEKAPGIQVHPAIEAVVLRCLNKNPFDRPQSASELYEQFRKALDETEAHDERAGTAAGAEETPRSREAIDEVKTHDEPPMHAEEVVPADAPSSPRRASGRMGLLMDFLARLGRSLKEAVTGSASPAKPGLQTKPREAAERVQLEEVPETIPPTRGRVLPDTGPRWQAA